MRTFEEVYDKIPAKGWLNEVEARLLWRCCEQTDGPILEVGCYHGRSACLLAEFGRQMYCVDPFKGFDTDDMSGENACRAFIRNMFTMHPNAKYQLFQVKVEDWEPHIVDLAYLDGDHTFEGTLAQINKALQCGPLVIAVHDYTDKMIRLACDERLGKPKLVADRLAAWGTIN